MTAKIKHTGEIINVEFIGRDSYRNPDNDAVYYEKELDIIDWEQRRFELVKVAMQGLLSTCSPGLLDKNLLAALSIDYADTVLDEYRKGGEE